MYFILLDAVRVYFVFHALLLHLTVLLIKLIMYFLFGMSALVKSVAFPRVNCVKLGENSVSSQSGQHMVKICT